MTKCLKRSIARKLSNDKLKQAGSDDVLKKLTKEDLSSKPDRLDTKVEPI